MSYEGYEQCICENGHYFETPCSYMFIENASICECGAKSVWDNSVDDTNCDSFGIVLKEDIDKLLISAEKSEVCNLGHLHITHKAIYRLPKKNELPRYYRDFETKKMVRI